jgi:hypothetical protein
MRMGVFVSPNAKNARASTFTVENKTNPGARHARASAAWSVEVASNFPRSNSSRMMGSASVSNSTEAIRFTNTR